MRWLSVFCFGWLGCAGLPSKPARIAHDCPSVPSTGAFKGAYIELASVKKSHLPRSLAKLKQQPIEVQQVAGVMAEDQTPVALEWDRCLDSKCELKLNRTLLITGYLPERGSRSVRIEVMIREGVGEHARMHIERVETRDQQPVAFDEHGDRSMMVATPYLLAGNADVQKLEACKR